MRPTLLVPLALLGGCIEYDVVVKDGIDVFLQKPADQVDILLVVDDSCSMEPYQTKLSQNFDSFLTYFIEGDVDYQIGITTTDNSNDAAGHLIRWGSGSDREWIITPETPNPEDRFAELVNVGTTGSGFEQGLEAAYKAITPPRTTNANLGFLREDAVLSIVMVSDEQDGSERPVNDYINDYFGVKGQRDRDVFNFSALTVTDESECTPDQAYASSPGTRYVDVAVQTHGIVRNLCSNAFDEIITDLSLNASRLNDTYFLSSNPDLDTLEVLVGEESIPCDAGIWTYQLIDSDGDGKGEPAIVFSRSALPAVGAQITVKYYFGQGDVESFCEGGT